jgi:two-component system OmpR family sensor kinase
LPSGLTLRGSASRRAEQAAGKGVPPAETDVVLPREPGWSGLAGSLRTRMLVSYLFLVIMSGGLSVVAIREVLIIRLEHRIEEAIRQEFQEITNFLADGLDPQTSKPFTSLGSAYDTYFRRNVPNREEAFIAFVNGQLHESVLHRYPLPARPLAEPALSEPADRLNGRIGRFDTDLGTAYYGVHPVSLGETTGTFVVTILPAAEHTEIRALQTYGVGVVVIVVLIASVFAWYVTGQLLIPVRQLTQTARMISRADQFHRIPVRGNDESSEMARTFNAMLDRLELVLHKQREFVLDASHELRGPLTICMGNLGLIQHGLIGDEPHERAETIALVTDELERMGRIVEDLRLLADSAHPDFLRLEKIELSSFVNEVAGKISMLAQRNWQVDANANGVIAADRDRLTQAFINLAQNAIHHTLPGDTIALGSAKVGDEARIWLRDTGAGISESELNRIFERFQRGADAHRRYRGSGLGLAIVDALARAHGGRVTVSSRPHHGSVFTLVLPGEPRRIQETWPEF